MKRSYQTERDFYLVQRLNKARNYEKMGFKANPFGYGLLGAYELDYMGSAEFEWGAIPESYQRFTENKLSTSLITINGHLIEYIYLTVDGDPADDMKAWVDKKCPGKEDARFYNRVIDKEDEWEKEHRTALFWSLNDDVIFGFAEDDNLEKLFDSLRNPDAQITFRNNSAGMKT